MENYKEIVTKAVVGKAKKSSSNTFTITPENKVDTILGCWVINHHFEGKGNNDNVVVNGDFDINVWYSYDNDTKTAVASSKFNYTDNLKVNLREKITDGKEIIVRSLKQPNVVNVKEENNKIELTVDKEIGVEVVGNTMIKVPIQLIDDDYDEIIEEPTENIDIEENYIK